MNSVKLPPSRFSRVIVHQFDIHTPVPGGIDTCIRGLLKYAPQEENIAVVGVSTKTESAISIIGVWQHVNFHGRQIWFLPVARLDPANQKRFIPHSVKLFWGLITHFYKLKKSDFWQFHRMDLAFAVGVVPKLKFSYFIHTQDGGLTGNNSDSIWRFFGRLHKAIERIVVKRARSVVVFNQDYATSVAKWNPFTIFSPTWWDPELITNVDHTHAEHRVLWVGRLEIPKDPGLALEAFSRLVEMDPFFPWSLSILGSGTLSGDLLAKISGFAPDVARRVTLHGRMRPLDVAKMMSESGLFLMTSHPGYEGFPRVLVEALASGLPSVVTTGSDTGSLIQSGLNGFVTSRNPSEIAEKLFLSRSLNRSIASESVKSLSAPQLVKKIFIHTTPLKGKVNK